MKNAIYSISDLASEFCISSRSIRFYEEKGLINPDRTAGNQRRYTKKDRIRLKLILRGKRFGYSLDEIAKMIGLADVDVNEIDQIRQALTYGAKKNWKRSGIECKHTRPWRKTCRGSVKDA